MKIKNLSCLVLFHIAYSRCFAINIGLHILRLRCTVEMTSHFPLYGSVAFRVLTKSTVYNNVHISRVSVEKGWHTHEQKNNKARTCSLQGHLLTRLQALDLRNKGSLSFRYNKCPHFKDFRSEGFHWHKQKKKKTKACVVYRGISSQDCRQLILQIVITSDGIRHLGLCVLLFPTRM